jgi:predicted glycoside hydrolase/deacetylase ChbG (UPF0249 family)
MELVAGRSEGTARVRDRRRLIINADDFGLSTGINRGILEAHEAGVVTSASLMVNTPGFTDAAARARTAPRLGVGLHLNLTAGRPLSPPHKVPSLCSARTGRLYSLARFAARALAGRVSAREVAIECAAQIERMRGSGVDITHLDGHQHAHVLPGVWQPVLATARRAGIQAVRVPLERATQIAWRPTAAVAQMLLRASHRVAARREGWDLRNPPVQFRGFALTGRRDFLERLLDTLDALEPGVTELMVHPGYSDDSLTEWVSYNRGRERELGALLSAPLRARLSQGDLLLIHFGDL